MHVRRAVDALLREMLRRGKARPVFPVARSRVRKKVQPIPLFVKLVGESLHALDRKLRAVPAADELFDRTAQRLADARRTALDDLRFADRSAVKLDPVDAAEQLAQQQLLIVPGNAGVPDEHLRREPDEHVAHIKEDIFYH